jgi:hypothetical protein
MHDSCCDGLQRETSLARVVELGLLIHQIPHHWLRQLLILKVELEWGCKQYAENVNDVQRECLLDLIAATLVTQLASQMCTGYIGIMG